MSKFNVNMKAVNKFDTTNREGAPAYALSDKSALVSLMLTSFLKDQFYRSGDETLLELQDLVSRVDPKFAAKAAIFARDEFGMRSVSHVVAAEVARYVKGEDWLRRFYKAVVVRPDDVTEIMAYWISNYGKPVPNAMKRGLGDALSSFDAYRLGKYKGEGKQLSLVDVVNLCHPHHTEPLGALVNGTLESPETWEVELTRAGTADDPEKAKKAVWMKLLSEHKLGYFALLRNLRNIMAQAPEAVDMVAAQLVDAEAIRKSRILPFRFLSAWDALAEVTVPRIVLEALSDAIDISVKNTPIFEGKTMIAVDGSGSMAWNGSWGDNNRGSRPIQIAALFAAALFRTNDADVMIFDDSVQWVRLNSKDSVRTNTSFIEQQAHAGGTDFHLIFQYAKAAYDRVVILSDMQAWISSYHGYSPEKEYKAYMQRTGADPFVYCLDLQGYGSAQYPAKKVVQLSGWSDKVFDYIKLAEKGTDAMVQAVEAVTL